MFLLFFSIKLFIIFPLPRSLGSEVHEQECAFACLLRFKAIPKANMAIWMKN